MLVKSVVLSFALAASAALSGAETQARAQLEDIVSVVPFSQRWI
jgi:hypothetical protein